jgi:hypothetical protein
MEIVPQLDEIAGSEGWLSRLLGAGYGAGLPINSNSVALENSRQVKSGAGTLFGFSGFSNKATSQFVLVFDAQTLPADGAVPVFVLTVPATSNFSASWERFGRSFDRGCFLCNSSTAATKTIGSADTWFDVQYV